MTALSGARTPRAFRHRAIEVNSSYIKRGAKRLRISALGPVEMNASPAEAKALAEARREYLQAQDNFYRLRQWQTRQLAN
jgi:hypothetical protein